MTGCVEKMKDKFLRFMYGRYGVDQFSQCLVVLGILFLLLSGFTRNGGIFYLLSLAILVYSYFRMFSRNHSKRYAENQLYLKYTAGIRKKISAIRYGFSQRKHYHIYKCPSCGQKIRIPRGKGKIEIRCPKCNAHFIKKS